MLSFFLQGLDTSCAALRMTAREKAITRLDIKRKVGLQANAPVVKDGIRESSESSLRKACSSVKEQRYLRGFERPGIDDRPKYVLVLPDNHDFELLALLRPA